MIFCQCLKPLARGPLGSSLRCCNGVGYLTSMAPLPTDRWALWSMRHGLYLYRAPWRVPANPQGHGNVP